MARLMPAPETVAIHERPLQLLQNLIRFDTSNPPGHEAECIGYVDGLLTAAGCRTTILARDPARPNLVTRLPGRGAASPLLLYGHVDVVPTVNQAWSHPPFAADVADGYVWGRGALDMKGGVAMMLAAFLRAKASALPLAGDLVLVLVSDEERGGAFGARWLVDNHPSLFQGVRYALGEFGGFTFTVGSRRFYPIMVAEKRPALVRLSVRAQGGHGSLVVRGGVAAQLGVLLQRLDAQRLPPHVTPVARQMFETMASALPLPAALALRGLLRPAFTDRVLDLLGEQGRSFEPLLHNTVNVTAVHAGEQHWGVPSEGRVDLAASLLPGYRPAQLVSELRQVVGPGVSIDVVEEEPELSSGDMGMFDDLSAVLREADPGAIPVPLLFPSPTDGRHFARLGIQTYGFIPMKLPADFRFAAVTHAADERIPLEAVGFGTDAIYAVLQRYGRGAPPGGSA